MTSPIEWVARREALGLGQAAMSAWVGTSQPQEQGWE